jgi:hypothetical protein
MNRNFCLHHYVQGRYPHVFPLDMATVGSFPRIMISNHEADHSPLSGAKLEAFFSFFYTLLGLNAYAGK